MAMIDTPDSSLPDNQTRNQTNSSQLSRRKTLYHFSLYLILLSAGGGLSYCWYFLTQKLVPLLEKPVSNYLSMDVELGEVEAVSWNSLRLGKSEIRTLNQDNDYVIAKAVEIKLNPWQLLHRKVVLGIKVIQPLGYLQQNQDQSWLNLNLAQEKKAFYGFVINVDSISVEQGHLSVQGQRQQTLLPLQQATIESARIDFEHHLNLFKVEGNLGAQSNFQVEGENQFAINQWLIKINGNNLPADTITQLNLFPLSLRANNGNLASNLVLKFDHSRLSEMRGSLALEGVELKIPSLYPTLNNTRGTILFADQTITLANLQTNMGLIPTVIKGFIANNQKLNLEIETANIEILDGIKTFNLPQLSFTTTGKIKGKATVTGDLVKPQVKATLTNVNPLTFDKLTFPSATAELTVFDSQLNLRQLTLSPDISGKIRGKGEVSLDHKTPTFKLDWQIEGIDGQKLANIYQQELPLEIGFLSGKYNLSGNWRQLSTSKLTGITSFPVAGGKATVSNLQIQNNQLSGVVNLSELNLEELPQLNCPQLGCENSVLDGEFKLSGNLNNLSPETINLVGDFTFNFAQGEVNFQQAQLNRGNWQTLIVANNLNIDKLPFLNSSNSVTKNLSAPSLSNTQPLIKSRQLSTELVAWGNLANPNDSKIEGKGKLELPQGKININQLTVINDNLTANLSTKELALADFAQDLRGKASGEVTIKGNLTQFTPNNLQIEGDLNFSQGIGAIQQPLFASFTYDGKKIWLKNAYTQEGISAQGVIEYDFNQASVKHFDLDINGRKIDLQQLPFPPQFNLFAYQGNADFQGNLVGNLSQPLLTGKVTLNNFSLANLPFATLTGKLTVSPQQGLDLNLASSQEQQADKLQIKLDKNYQPQFINLLTEKTQLIATKKQENLEITLNHLPLAPLTQPYLKFLPEKIHKIGGEVSATMNLNLDTYDLDSATITITQPSINHLQGDLLTAHISSTQGIFNVTEGKLIHHHNQYEFRGELPLNADNPQMQAEFTIADGDIQELLTSLEIFEVADLFRGIQPRQYATAQDLYESEERQTTKSPQLPSEVSPKPLFVKEFGYDYQLTAEVVTPLDNHQQPQSTNNSLSAKKPLAEIGDNNQSLLEKINLLEKIENQLAQQKRQRQLQPLPPLANLDGKFIGKVNLAVSAETGINAEFDFQGNDWEWGLYDADFLQAKGSYQNGLLTLLPITIHKNNSTVSLTGTFDEERISGQIRVEDLPIAELNKFINFPENLNVKGEINGNIAISGDQQYLLAKGSLDIDDIKINGHQIDSLKSSFGYKNSRITFLTNSNLQENEKTLTITGTLPLQIFSNSVQPESDKFEFNLNMNKNGFNLLDIITNNEFNWIEGNGNINLDITGNYQQSNNKIKNLHTQGVINVEQGTMTANILPDKPLTNINGKILFDFDQLNITNLSGDFSGGNIKIKGNLPLTEETLTEDSLSINLENIALNLNELYQGNAQGEIVVTGKMIAPEISGNLEIFNGKINLVENINNSQQANLTTNSWLGQTKINDFNLILGDNITISKIPLLKVKATGNINLNGSLQGIEPEGIIQLKLGKINLFTSQLRLAESYENIAKITPENGFDPYLDLELEGSVTETSRHQFVDNSHPNEIRDLSNSSVTTAQTIRVKAKVQGLSSDLPNKLELTSSPKRSESEIIALLGGGFFNNFTEGNDNLSLANLASAAFLGSFQGDLGEALGFDEFRFFPTQILDPEKRTSTMGFGAEIGIDLTKNFSVSVFKILTNEQQPQYSLRYRINDQFNLRGSSDFEQDSRAVLEFQQRF